MSAHRPSAAAAPGVACLLPSPPFGLGLRSALARCGVEAASFSCIDALAAAVRHGTALVVMEYRPATWRGWHMLLQTHGAGTVPVLAIGQAQVADMADALAHGACDYLVRTADCMPIAERILARLHVGTARAEAAPKGLAQGLDAATRTLVLGARRIELSNPEFRLAQVFLGHPGQLFDTQALARLAWDGRATLCARAVARQVMNLRRKLDSVPAAPRAGKLQLQTVHGMGYRLQVTAAPAMH